MNNLGTFLRMGNASSGNSDVSVVLDSSKPFNVGTLINVKNKRTFAFPQFLMEWVDRQTEEITTALLTPPTLTVIMPSSIGANSRVDGSMTGFLDQFSKAYGQQGVDNLKKQM